jgi:hydroxyethylthiazole kinase-like uncharacterized protein yjeF
VVEEGSQGEYGGARLQFGRNDEKPGGNESGDGMTELLTAQQMRGIEQAAIKSGAVTGLELMERAGRGVVEAVFEHWPDLAAGPFRAVVLCGPGNNGGDGFVVARLLRERGWAVEVFLYGDPARLPPDARVNFDAWCGMGDVGGMHELAHYLDTVPPGLNNLFVDALFGTGLARPIPPEARGAFSSAFTTELAARTVAIDVPSGLCSDSGAILIGNRADAWDPCVTGWCAVPDLAVTFHRPKLGLMIADGPRIIEKLAVKDIGLPAHIGPGVLPVRGVVRMTGVPPIHLRKLEHKHKYAHGHALIVSGGPGQTGAARLAARGALRIGAGLVTLAVPPEAVSEVASQVTAIMLKRVADADALAAVLEDARFNAVCLGPGLGVERAQALVETACTGGKPRPTVLDADALTAFADAPDELFVMLHEGCVLTPHGGEFARLFPDIAARLTAVPVSGPAYSKVDATRAAAARAGCTVLFKGADTVIAAPDGACVVSAAHYDRAAPWLATAGSGDVLAGFITGLLARGFSPMSAAETAAWLHVECARHFGPGLIAEDLPEQLPAVLRAVGV